MQQFCIDGPLLNSEFNSGLSVLDNFYDYAPKRNLTSLTIFFLDSESKWAQELGNVPQEEKGVSVKTNTNLLNLSNFWEG